MNSGHPKHLFLSLPKSQSDFAHRFGAIWNEALQVFEIPADEARLYSEEGQELFPFLLNAAVPKFEPPRVSRRPNFLREYPNEKYLFT